MSEQHLKTILKQLAVLKSKDNEYCKLTKLGIKSWFKFSVTQMEIYKETTEKYHFAQNIVDELMFITGSSAEGGALCRWINKKYPSLEFDIMFSMATLPYNHWNQNVIQIPNNPDFFYIANTPDILSCVNKGLEHFSIDFGDHNNQYLSIPNVKGIVQDVTQVHLNENIMQVILGVKNERCNVLPRYSENGPAVTAEFEVQVDGKTIIEVSSDLVICIRLPFWPQQASDWFSPNRRRYWPEAEVLARAREIGCDMVAKKPPDHETLTSQWHLSFSLAEQVLMNSFSWEQSLCYFIAKVIFYKHVKPIVVTVGTDSHNEIYIPSYTLKTCMLWLLEETDPNEWTLENLVNNIAILYTKLASVLETYNVSNFFLPQCNNLRCYPKQLLNMASAKAFEIAADVSKFCPDLETVNRIDERIAVVLNNWPCLQEILINISEASKLQEIAASNNFLTVMIIIQKAIATHKPSLNVGEKLLALRGDFITGDELD